MRSSVIGCWSEKGTLGVVVDFSPEVLCPRAPCSFDAAVELLSRPEFEPEEGEAEFLCSENQHTPTTTPEAINRCCGV